jgi:hypothetical protein
MPQFGELDEYLREGSKIEILEMVCPNNGKKMDNAYYPYEKYPELYQECELCQNKDNYEKIKTKID